jgi:hypothetical protein
MRRDRDLDLFIVKLVNEDSPLGTTLRHIYYVCASSKFCPLSQKGYNKINGVVRRLRENELLNADNILDGTRIWREPYVFSSPGDFLLNVQDQYQKDLWEDQNKHVAIFSQKDAMTSLLSDIADRYRIPYAMVRGFISDSHIGKIANAWNRLPEDKLIHILYVGDHDPSGKNLSLNVNNKILRKLWKINKDFDQERILWSRVAATEEDLNTYSQFVIPCKITDTRAPKYKAKYGDRCLEVDAIEAEEIVSRLEKAILKRIDMAAWEKAEKEEVKEQKKLSEAIVEISDQF